MIQVAIGRVKTVTYLTQGYAVGELTEYHAHKVAPGIKTLDMFVRSMLFFTSDLIKSLGNCWIT